MGELTYSQPLPRRVQKPKGPTARARAKRARAESPVKKAVRAACVERDGHCRVSLVRLGDAWVLRIGDRMTIAPDTDVWGGRCEGPSEWAHLEGRARTRNMRPDVRHNTKTSLMLCRKHHDQLDGRARPRLRVDVQTGKGADGPLTWRTA